MPVTALPALILKIPNDLRGGPIGVAVSGGSDSLALLHLLVDAGLSVAVASVDHGLRPEAAAECRAVADVCAALGVTHRVLCWDGWDGEGNLQDAARAARYALLAGWAADAGLGCVALGHTADDQAETVLMRLARGAGVDGLAAMPDEMLRGGVRFVRPMLHMRRSDLRSYLTAKGARWADDPSNVDRKYERVKTRQAMAGLAEIGVTADALVRVAAQMGQAKGALAVDLAGHAAQFVVQADGDLLLARAALDLHPEHLRRLVLAMLGYLNGHVYPPRRAEQMNLIAQLQAGKKATLAGCVIAPETGMIRFSRELSAVATLICATDAIWDGRWAFDGAHVNDLAVRALGLEGLRDCEDWRATGIPRASLLASPAIWRRNDLIAAPLAGYDNGWQVRIVADFHSSVVTH